MNHTLLEDLLMDPRVTEIFVNGPQSVWYEQSGQIKKSQTSFSSELDYEVFIELLLSESKQQLSQERPSLEVPYKNFRITLISEELTKSSKHICIRKHPINSWTFDHLLNYQWCTNAQKNTLIELLCQRKSILIIGPTGCGKTSVISALLNELPDNERCILIEDTPELHLPNPVSLKLITRSDFFGTLAEINQTDLLKKCLRLRPDRIVMGEIRGSESKDFLMALSSGHRGGLASLHAHDPHQALLRLEMLVQMGAPQWNLDSIRRLLFLSLEYIVLLDKESHGKRQLKGIFKISSLESYGLLIESVA